MGAPRKEVEFYLSLKSYGDFFMSSGAEKPIFGVNTIHSSGLR